MNPSDNNPLNLPNTLTFFRIFLLPFLLIFLLQGQKNAVLGLWILSGVTDVADGFLARKLHQVTALGKLLDPIADKLTQGVLLIGLCPTVPAMFPLLLFLILKEGIMILLGAPLLQTVGAQSSKWHGKAAAAVLFFVIAFHLIVKNPQPTVSFGLVLSAVIFMTVSALLYIGQFLSTAEQLRNV